MKKFFTNKWALVVLLALGLSGTIISQTVPLQLPWKLSPQILVPSDPKDLVIPKLGESQPLPAGIPTVAFSAYARDVSSGAPVAEARLTVNVFTGDRNLLWAGIAHTDQYGYVSMTIPQGQTEFLLQPLQPVAGKGYNGMGFTVTTTGPELHYDFKVPITIDEEQEFFKKSFGDIKGSLSQDISVGFVRDKETGELLSGTTFTIKGGNLKYTTETDGKFILSLSTDYEKGSYPVTRTYGAGRGAEYQEVTIIIEKEGYKTKEFQQQIEPGALWGPLNFELEKINTNTSRKPPVSGGFRLQPRGNQNYSDCIQRSVAVLYNGSIDVANPPCCGGGSISCSQIVVVSIEDYVKRVLPNEWIPSWIYYSNGIESFKAAAVAIRSYILYRMLYNPVSTNNYHAKAGPCFQAFGKMDGNISSAVTSTTNEILVRPDGNVAMCEYSAENNNLGSQCNTAVCGNSSNPGYGNGYIANCSGSGGINGSVYDPVGIGRTICGHGRGMCQYCSARWATGLNLNGVGTGCTGGNVGNTVPTGQGQKSYYFILNHYYPNFSHQWVPTCIYPANQIANIICAGNKTYVWESTNGKSNYYTRYNKSGIDKWNMTGPEKVYRFVPTTSGTVTVSLSNMSNPNLYPFVIATGGGGVGNINPENSSQVVGGPSSTSSYSTSFYAVAGGEYFIIIDGRQVAGSPTGQAGGYSLTVSTPCSNTSNGANLTWTTGTNMNQNSTTVNVNVSMKNTGTNITDPWYMLSFLSTVPNYTSSSVMIASAYAEYGLSAGNTGSVSYSRNLSNYNIASGQYYLVTLIDGFGSVTETNENDNGFYFTNRVTKMIGSATPIAIYKPIEINGNKIQVYTPNNHAWIYDLLGRTIHRFPMAPDPQETYLQKGVYILKRDDDTPGEKFVIE
jgi:hypothetical protein